MTRLGGVYERFELFDIFADRFKFGQHLCDIALSQFHVMRFRMRLAYDEPSAVSDAVGYAKFFSRSRDAVIRVYDEAGNVIETHEHAGDFKEW